MQCAAGMRMYDPVYLEMLREACDRHGVLLIADEIAVGFGRTGTMFACEQAGIRPDLCLSKGLTGGYPPPSVVMTTDAIYDAFYDDYVQLQRIPALRQPHRQSPALLRCCWTSSPGTTSRSAPCACGAHGAACAELEIILTSP